MAEKVDTDVKTLKLIFDRNRSFLFPIITILVCIFLILQIIIPQLKILSQAKETAQKMSVKLDVMKKNLSTLANIDEDSLESQLRILNFALPVNKDFSSVLDAIYFASQNAGVTLGAFSFRIGDISKDSGKGSLSSTIDLSLYIDGDVQSVSRFVRTIGETLPLSEISSIKIGDKTSNLNLAFYYKLLNASDYSQDSPVNPVSQKGISLIEKLASSSNAPSLSVSESSESEEPPIEVASSPSARTTNPFAD